MLHSWPVEYETLGITLAVVWRKERMTKVKFHWFDNSGFVWHCEKKNNNTLYTVNRLLQWM